MLTNHMIPVFTPEGVLPPSPDGQPYICTRDEAEEHLVLALGDTPWRRSLFDEWDLLRGSIAVVVPSARWWLWGSLVTAMPEPLFGERATVNTAVVVHPAGLPADPAALGLLASSVHSALSLHRVDAKLIVAANHRDARAHELQVWRRRASRAIVDLESREMIPSGFIEVLP